MSEIYHQLEKWMKEDEGENLEFKEAKNNYEFEELVKYIVALANEGGGKLIFGVTDKKPRKIVGSAAFSNLERTKSGIIDRVRLRVDVEVINHPQGRVLVFHVPSRPIGTPIHYEGRYFMRSGEQLVPMLPDMLKRIIDEAGPDFSAEICKKADMNDLEISAIEEFRKRWIRKSGNDKLLLRSTLLIIHKDFISI